jgi:hypothetical protein
LASLEELTPGRSRTVVINVNTDLVAARAVLSAVDVVGDPVLVVNCDPTEESRAHFGRLMGSYDFDLIEAPLRLHGETLDWLFTALDDERLLLLDSDAEVRDPAFVDWMRAKLDHPLTFGAGFTWGPFFITEEWLAPPDSILYMERPWVPCVWFKTSAVRAALDTGLSFSARFVPNDVAFSPRVSRFLAARWGPPWSVASRRFSSLPASVQRRLSTWRLDALRWARRRYHGLQPSMVCYDTGSEVYQHLRFEKEMLFAGIPMELIDDEVHHYSGVTRYSLYGSSALDTKEEDVADEVIDRLASRYGYAWKPA